MSRSRVTFIPTTSLDGTCDLVVSRLGSDAVFRFNTDLWRDYAFRAGPDGFEIASPTGRRVTSADIAKVYWRKPQRTRGLYPDKKHSREDSYMEDELWHAFRDVVGLLWSQGKVVLVEPEADDRLGKLAQLWAAADLFPVAPWTFACGDQEAFRPGAVSVVKSLTLGRVADKSVLYATRVDEGDLDPSFPWFMNDYVDAPFDVTAVYVRGNLFAFEFPRHRFADRSIDWRAVSLEDGADWRTHALPNAVVDASRTLMSRLGLAYGRFDFLLTGEGDYVFLEVNPNGEWGWLDKDGANGILNRILDEISPETRVNPLPAPPHRPLAPPA